MKRWDERLKRLEARMATKRARSVCPVVIHRPGDDVAAMVAERHRALEAAGNKGQVILVLPDNGRDQKARPASSNRQTAPV